jgi:4-alpha-glucanotransferase
MPGPGAAFFGAVERALGGLPFVAEDLGLITPDVGALRDEFGIPGTRVLQFAFDGHADNPYLPGNYVPNTVAYTGTHDNATTRGWYEDLPGPERGNLWRYLKRAEGAGEDAAPALLGLAWSSVAALAMAPLQDVLNLGREARMNTPGSAGGNWRWRVTDEQLSGSASSHCESSPATPPAPSARWPSRHEHRAHRLPRRRGQHAAGQRSDSGRSQAPSGAPVRCRVS